MAKANADGMIQIGMSLHETIYDELMDAKKAAHERLKKIYPANAGKRYSWGRWIFDLYRYAKEHDYEE